MTDFLPGLYVGDCLTGMRQGIRSGSVQLACADPPFNVDFDYHVEYTDNRSPVEYRAWCEEWMREVHRVLSPTGSFWLIIGNEWAADLQILAREIGFHRRATVAWYVTFGVNCAKNFSRSHVQLLYFTKHRTQFTFNADDPAVRVPSARQLIYNDKRANPKGRLPDDTWILRPQDLPDGFDWSEDVWHISRVCGSFKERAGTPNQIPQMLLGRIVRLCSNPGDLVLDPMAGSGSSLIVAKKLGRQYIGFEQSAKFAGIAEARLQAVKPGDQLDGSPPQGGMPP